jgi:methyl-accepting chemotaxis protein
VTLNATQAAANASSIESSYSSSRTLTIVILAIAVLLAAGIAFLVTRVIRSSVNQIMERLELLKDKGADRVTGALKALAEGDLTHEFQIDINEVTEFPGDELGSIQRTVEELRGGIVTSLEAYSTTRAKLNALMGDVSGSAERVSAASEQMAATSEETGKATGEIAHAVADIAQGAERQVQMAEQARSAAAEVSGAVLESAENAQRTAEVARQAREIAQQGVGAAEKANEAMRAVRESSEAVNGAIRELAAKSGQIGAIVQTITGIAEQTNLLALNAAIEAARAGDQGRGFAVVAEEVRKLAEESQHAAEEISQLIGAIQGETTNAVSVVERGAQRTADGAAVVEQTREAFLQIGASVDDMTGRIEQIAAAAEQIAASAETMQTSIVEVATVAEQSSASTEEVSASIEQTSASAQEIAASAQELSRNAEDLNRLVAQFTLAA